MPGTTGPRPEQETANERSVRDEERHRDHINLDRRYGQIGISAVAAALRYSEVTKNPAYAPAIIRIDWQLSEAAA